MKDNKIKLAALIPVLCSIVMAFTSVCQVILTIKRDTRNYVEENSKHSAFIDHNTYIDFQLYSSFTTDNNAYLSLSYTNYYIFSYLSHAYISVGVINDVAYCSLVWYNLNEFHVCCINIR